MQSSIRAAAFFVFTKHDNLEVTKTKTNNNAARLNVTAKEAVKEAAASMDSAIEQILWERDTAIQQLKNDYHVGFGESQNPLMKALPHTDWSMLFKQKLALYTIECEMTNNNCGAAADYLSGVVHFLDELLDAAEEKGLFEAPEYDLETGRYLDDRYNINV